MLTLTYSLLDNFLYTSNSERISGNIVCDCILGSASAYTSTTTIIIIVIVICVVIIMLICICFIIIFVTRREREREESYPAMDNSSRVNGRINAQSIDVLSSRNGRHCYPNCRDEIPAVAWSRGKEYIPRHYPRGVNGYPYYVQPRIYGYHVPANKRHYPSSYISSGT